MCVAEEQHFPKLVASEQAGKWFAECSPKQLVVSEYSGEWFAERCVKQLVVSEQAREWVAKQSAVSEHGGK